jgi:chemotaxis protein CheX
MDVRFINAFLEGTISVLKTMAFIEPKPGKPYLKKDALARGDISGIIGLTGSVTGSMALSFSEKSILKIVSNMLGEEIKEINGDIKDAVGEMKEARVDGLKCFGGNPYCSCRQKSLYRPCAGWAKYYYSI